MPQMQQVPGGMPPHMAAAAAKLGGLAGLQGAANSHPLASLAAQVPAGYAASPAGLAAVSAPMPAVSREQPNGHLHPTKQENGGPHQQQPQSSQGQQLQQPAQPGQPPKQLPSPQTLHVKAEQPEHAVRLAC